MVPTWMQFGLAGWFALLVAGVPHLGEQALPLTIGGVAGCLLAVWQRNPARSPGLVPIAALLLVLGLGWCWLLGAGPVPALLCGLAGGLGFVPLLAASLGRGFWPIVVLAVALWWLPSLGLGVVLLLTLGFAVSSAYLLFAPLVEQILEIAMAPLWRVRKAGPGANAIPLSGPVVIVCNHTSYIDPLWVGKVVPRKVIAMMTSVFYDVPLVRWLMVHVTKAIRVPTATFRREAPELQDAIRVLQSGGCLLIFPEARLRKTEEKLLYPFGQGLWHILKAVPETRVVTLWIEGGWGSWTSHGHGSPPFKGKGIDWFRAIALGISKPEPVARELLEDREAFRLWLMERVLESRRFLDLPVPTVEQALGREPVDISEPHQMHTDSDGNT